MVSSRNPLGEEKMLYRVSPEMHAGRRQAQHLKTSAHLPASYLLRMLGISFSDYFKKIAFCWNFCRCSRLKVNSSISLIRMMKRRTLLRSWDSRIEDRRLGIKAASTDGGYRTLRAMF
jgi:hypothetical protein